MAKIKAYNWNGTTYYQVNGITFHTYGHAYRAAVNSK